MPTAGGALTIANMLSPAACPYFDCKVMCKLGHMDSRQVRPRHRLKDSPLILVLCQIRFAPVLTMEKFIPQIQDELRRKGYPGYEQTSVHEIHIGENGPSFRESLRWVFSSQDRSKFLILTNSTVALEVVEYSTFEQFLLDLAPGIEALSAAVQPTFAHRLGLRYVDALPAIGDEVSKFFKEKVLSFRPEELGVEALLSSQQVIARTDVGQLMIRMNQVENAPLLPADLQSPELSGIADTLSGVHAILDIDSSDERQGQFDLAEFNERLWAIHDYASAAFWESITEYAKSAWKIEELESAL